MKKIVPLLLLLLAACEPQEYPSPNIFDADIQAGYKACKPHDGVRWMTRPAMGPVVHTMCNDSTLIYLKIHTKKD